jgi:hypothetical protein
MSGHGCVNVFVALPHSLFAEYRVIRTVVFACGIVFVLDYFKITKEQVKPTV